MLRTIYTEVIGQIKTQNWIQRCLAGLFLISCLVIITYFGVAAIGIFVAIVQVKCFQEIIAIAYNFKKIPEIPLFRTLNWYLLFVANYFLFGETFVQYLEVFAMKYHTLDMLFKYHRFLSFCCYMIGIIWFLGLLRRKNIRQQFSILAWVHFLCIIIVLQSYMIYQNLFEGLIWFVLPHTLVYVNDIFAYVCGKMYGKTPLIKVSPKKTLEGFLGGFLGTLVVGTLVAWLLCHIDHIVCPTKFIATNATIKMTIECTRNYLFQPLTLTTRYFSINYYYPFLFHAFILVLFASFIAPFGGFCASGFKRAVNMKDFGDTIPGHGGVMDRFDCQYLMATFVNVYITSFLRNYSVEKMLGRVLYLSEDGQLEFYNLLKQNLKLHKML